MSHRTLSPGPTSRPLLIALIISGVALGGCPGGNGNIGDECRSNGECDATLQCGQGVCVPRCARAPECGDGYSCDSKGLCHLATGQPGDVCTSEVDCAPGLSCQLDGTATDAARHLLASCAAQYDARPAGSECVLDADCRNGTCALGHCLDLCDETRDCGSGTACMDIPRVEVVDTTFRGCVQAKGNIVWSIPPATSNVLLPVPSGARFAELVLSVDDLVQKVGAQRLISPSGRLLYTRPCEIQGGGCDPDRDYYANLVRHEAQLGQSVITLPSTPKAPLETGIYRIQVSSFRPNGTAGSAIPHVTAIVRVDAPTVLDLHFHFLDLDAHPCEAGFGGARLDARAAQAGTLFQNDFVGELQTIFAHAGIALGSIDYVDVLDHPDLDGLDVADAGSLLALGESPVGINVFFVRTLSPVGLQAFGPNPGPAGIGKTRQSGIIVGVDTLCYRSWTQLARLTAHELARYMGLHHNVELGTYLAGTPPAQQHWADNIDDSDESSNNLMYFSEIGGIELSPGQREILTRSGVLR
ncbi:MAG: hypothetical protein H6Q90_4515 [Deltaproteobacteria bacterium]|nr:hypothetical protein [Deltaproteobacteria bacterium]